MFYAAQNIFPVNNFQPDVDLVETVLQGATAATPTLKPEEMQFQTGSGQTGSGQTGNSQLCSKEEEILEDTKRTECFSAADAKFQESLTDPNSNYATSLCEEVSNKVNYCTVTFNQVCSSPEQIVDYQMGESIMVI